MLTVQPCHQHRPLNMHRNNVVSFPAATVPAASVGPGEIDSKVRDAYDQNVLNENGELLSKNAVDRVCMKAVPSLLPLVPCCFHVNLHAQTAVPFGRNGKYNVSHIGCHITDAAAT